jgi:hypothetical protein
MIFGGSGFGTGLNSARDITETSMKGSRYARNQYSHVQRYTKHKAVHNVLRDSLVPLYLGKWHGNSNSVINHIS